jgi:hypothetical protein
MTAMASRRLFYPGRKVQAICRSCGKITRAVYGYGTVPLEDGTPVEGVMRAVCEHCGTLVATAPQSIPLVRAALEARAEKPHAEGKERTTVRIPRVLADYARWALFELKAPDVERFDLLVKAFVMSMVNAGEKRRSEIVTRLGTATDPALEQPFEYSLSLNLSEQLWEYLDRIRMEAGIANISELIRRILVLMETDRKSEDELRKLVLLG